MFYSTNKHLINQRKYSLNIKKKNNNNQEKTQNIFFTVAIYKYLYMYFLIKKLLKL